MSLLKAVLQEAEETSKKEFMEKWEEISPRVQELYETIMTFSCALQDNFVEMYLKFQDGETLEQLHYKIRRPKIDAAYQNIKESINKMPKLNRDAEANAQLEKLHDVYNLFTKLCVVSEGEQELNKAQTLFRRFQYEEAIKVLIELKSNLEKVYFEGNSQEALVNFSDAVNAQYSTYCGEISAEWENIFSFKTFESPSNLTFSFYIQQQDKVLVQTILQTLHSTGRLNAELASFSDFFLYQVLKTLLRRNCEIFTDEQLSYLVFNIKIDQSDHTEPSFQSIFTNLTATFEFLESAFASFCDEHSFISILALSISDQFFKRIIKECIEPNLPYNDLTYQKYKSLVLELESFNKFLIGINFVHKDHSPLEEYMVDIKNILYTSKCKRLVCKSEHLMKESLSKGTVQVGTKDENDTFLDETVTRTEDIVNAPAFLPRCVVSENVKLIISLINNQLEEAIEAKDIFLWKMIACIDDIVIKYKELVPCLYKVNLAHCPKEIALFFNNCFYLAHALASLPDKSLLPTDASYSLNLVLLNSIMDLRVLGLDKLTKYLQTEKDAIGDAIYPLNDLIWDEEAYSQFDLSITKLMEKLCYLKECWLCILPIEMFNLSISELADALCQVLIKRVICGCPKVDEKLIYKLILRIEGIIKDLGSMFKNKNELEQKIPSWAKFIILPRLLKAQLLEITTMWNEAKNLSTYYTCEEVRHVIKMRFSNDDYMLNILKEIQ